MTMTPPVVVVVRASTGDGSTCAGSSILTNTNTVREHLLDALRCFVARRDLLLVVRSLRGGADAMCKEGHAMAPGPQNRCASAAQRCSPQYVEIDRPIFDGHLAIIQAQSNVLGFGRLNPTEGTPMEKKWRVSHVELLEGGLLFRVRALRPEEAGRVFHSAMRMTRKRMWAAIMLRQRLRTRSKFSVAELRS